MFIKQHKSGQATIVLIVVTMMTVLGVAVASSSQSRINLRDTVYSTQTLQALSCAEAGADRALIDTRMDTNQALSGPITIASGSDPTYAVEGCQGYTATINNYPGTPGPVTVLSIPENAVQEFNASSFSGTKTIHFKSNENGVNPGLAIYFYHGSASSPQVTRRMIYCNEGEPFPSQAPDDFEVVNSGGTITLDDGVTQVQDVCTVTVTTPANPVVMRVRPLYADQLFQIQNFQGNTGYRIVSTGTAGQVQRNVNVIRFYNQLSGVFDEGVVAGGGIQDN